MKSPAICAKKAPNNPAPRRQCALAVLNHCAKPIYARKEQTVRNIESKTDRLEFLFSLQSGFAELKTLGEALEDQGFPIYVVGGAVRNLLMGLPVSDIDICSAATPDQIMALCRRMGFKCIPKAPQLGTVEIIAGDTGFEHTTFRSESYGEGGRHRPEQVRFAHSIEEDAQRRDFSMNALYYGVCDGKLYDPTGGLDDIGRGVIRAASSDANIVLNDDGLRIMRMVRFAAELGFDIEENTFAAASDLCGRLMDVSAERIRDELNKILLSDIKYARPPADSVLRGLLLMRDVGAVETLLCELYRGNALAQKPTHHRYDVLEHCFNTAACMPPKLSLRLAGLLHDVGKPAAWHRNGNMYGHDVMGEGISREILYRFKYDGATIETVCFLVRNHMYDLNNTAKESTLRERFCVWGEEKTLMMADMREADVHGSGIITGEVASAERWRRLLARMQEQGVPFNGIGLNCTGRDIMRWKGIGPSPAVGRIKSALLRHCAKKPADNTPERLERIVRDMNEL